MVLSRKVEDLTALAGMNTLEHLYFESTTISDLSPLKGMKLTTLTMCTNPVSDLSPLKGMKLTFLHCGDTKVSDLSPLNGMPLTLLNCSRTKVSDASLADIKDCKDLTQLFLAGTQVSDAGLAHLKDHKNLKRLELQGTKVSSLSPLAGHAARRDPLDPQEHQQAGSGDPPQHEEPQNHRHRTGTRAWPAAEFWARYEKGEFKK